MYHVTGELTWFKSVAQLVATFVRLHPRVPQQVRSRGCHQRALLTTQSLEGWGGGWRVGEAQMYPSPSVSSFCPLSQLSIQRTLAALITCAKSSAPTPPPRVFTRFSPSLPRSVCRLVEAAARLSSLIVRRLPPVSPHYASGQLRNNRRGQGSELLEFLYANQLNHAHAHTHVLYMRSHVSLRMNTRLFNLLHPSLFHFAMSSDCWRAIGWFKQI